jgi:K+-transporting ATPase ATPase A chain
VNNDFYNYGLGDLHVPRGRFAIIVPVLAIAGSMVGKKIAPPSPGTIPDDRPHLCRPAHRRRAS